MKYKKSILGFLLGLFAVFTPLYVYAENITYSGTMNLSGSTLTLTTNKEKNNDTSVETPVGPWDDVFTVSDTAIVEGTITFSKQ